MLTPAPRLLLASVVVALPLAEVAGMFPRAMVICVLWLAICAAVAAYDGVAALRAIALVTVRTPGFIRLTKDVAAGIPVTVENSGQAACPLRLGVMPPTGVETDSPVLEVSAPAGASVVEWPFTGRARGDHPLRELHLETASPLGLWLARQARPLEFSFRVYPNLRDRATAALFLRTANVGLRVRRQVGKGREFDNLRQYLPGDGFEDIDWKATARRRFPVVKLYRVEHAQEVYAVVDSSRL